MDRQAIDRAAALLAEAHRTGTLTARLPEDCRPDTIADAHAVQDALVALLGEAVPAYKVAGLEPGKAMRGAVLASRLYAGPARIPVARVPMLGIEAEIAFRLDRDLPPREAAYSRDEVAAAVTALPAIEVVATRFADYQGTSLLERLCDCMANGALVCGPARADWRDFDFAAVPVTVRGSDGLLVETVNGHANGDPLLPTVAFVNEMRSGVGLQAGRIVTAGTFSGLTHTSPGATVSATFEGFGSVEVRFDP